MLADGGEHFGGDRDRVRHAVGREFLDDQHPDGWLIRSKDPLQLFGVFHGPQPYRSQEPP